MRYKAFIPAIVTVCLMAHLFSAAGQEKERKLQTISTANKVVVSEIRLDGKNAFKVNGEADFTVTQANSDDTVTGTISYKLPDDARNKLAVITGKPLAEIPGVMSQKEITCQFQAGTICPVIHLEFPGMSLNAAGAPLVFNRFTLDLIESEAELSKLFCRWTTSLNRIGQRRYTKIINNLLNGETDDEKNNRKQ
jgi:hypothetical protein